MVRKSTRVSALKAKEKPVRESPRRSRRRRSSSKSEDSDNEVLANLKVQLSEKGSSGNDSDTDAKKPLKKRTRSKAAKGNVETVSKAPEPALNTQQDNQIEEEVKNIQPDSEETNDASKGKLGSNNGSAVAETENDENLQVTDKSPPFDTKDDDEASKNGTEIDVNVSESIVAEMTCTDQSLAEQPTEPVVETDIPKASEPEASKETSNSEQQIAVTSEPEEKAPSEPSPKKIKLNRPPSVASAASDNKDESVKKKITLKRPENTKKQESEEAGGASQEGPEETPPNRRKITLKRSTTDSNQENSEPQNIVINERRRRSSATLEKPPVEAEEKPKKPSKVIKLIRNLPEAPREPPPPGEAPLKRHKWGRIEDSTALALNLDDFKQICHSIELLNEEELDLQIKEKPIKRKTFKELEDEEMENIEAELNAEHDQADSKESIIALNRKISIVEDTASKLQPPPSPPKNPVSEVLFITNLVRPFTVKQLKELLERTGKIQDEGFWTDKIKSKCYVQYESSEQAEATRNALHGVHWPIGNGKKLVIDYATAEDLEKAKNPPLPVPKKDKSPEKENLKPDRDGDPADKREVRIVTREWDIGKEDDRRRSQSRERRDRKHSRRSYTPDDHHHKKAKREEAAPPKAMDDLFLKTKATPSIYWQPLSPEEIAQKQQQRQVRLEENKRRLEKIRSSARSGIRDRSGRDRSFRRR